MLLFSLVIEMKLVKGLIKELRLFLKEFRPTLVFIFIYALLSPTTPPLCYLFIPFVYSFLSSETTILFEELLQAPYFKISFNELF